MAKRKVVDDDQDGALSRVCVQDTGDRFLTDKMTMVKPYVDEVDALRWVKEILLYIPSQSELHECLKNARFASGVKWAAMVIVDIADLWMLGACMDAMEDPTMVAATLLQNVKIDRAAVLECIVQHALRSTTHHYLVSYLSTHHRISTEPPQFAAVFYRACKDYGNMAWLDMTTRILQEPNHWHKDTYIEALLTACDCGEDILYVKNLLVQALPHMSDDNIVAMKLRECRPFNVGLVQLYRTTDDTALRARLKPFAQQQ